MAGLFVIGAALALNSTAQTGSICGQDERSVHAFAPVGVVRKANQGPSAPFCTVTLVGDSCAVSAGHCLHLLEEAEFSLPTGSEFQSLSAAKYSVIPGSVRALQSRIGNDWAVMRFMPNRESGLLPGKVHGFVELNLNAEQETPSAVYTYASRRDDDNRFEVVVSDGSVLWTQGSVLFHNLDTERGSSGALIFDSATNLAVAIHTHGGCDTMKNNKATYVSQLPNLINAIRMCRKEEGSH